MGYIKAEIIRFIPIIYRGEKFRKLRNAIFCQRKAYSGSFEKKK